MKKIEYEGKTVYAYTLAELKSNLRVQIARDDKKAIRAMLVIYSFQTEYEKESEETIEDNGCGFSGIDSKLMSSFSTFYTSKGFLSPKQMNYVRKIMPKYAGQLLDNSISQGKIVKVARGEYVIVR